MSAWVLQKADMFSVRRDAGPAKDEEAMRGEVRQGEASATEKGCGIHTQKARFAPLSSFIFPLSPFPSLRGDGAPLLPIPKQAQMKTWKMAVDSPVGACLSIRRQLLANMERL